MSKIQCRLRVQLDSGSSIHLNQLFSNGLFDSEQEIEANFRALRILFLKNEPEKLLKTKDEPKKRTGNKPETNLAILLKLKDFA